MASMGDDAKILTNHVSIDSRGLIIIDIRGAQTHQSIEDLYRQLVTITTDFKRRGKKILVLVDLAQLNNDNSTPEARMFSKRLFKLPYDRVALIGPSRFLMISMVALRATTNKRVRAFSHRHQAVRWLKSEQQPHPNQPITNVFVGLALICLGLGGLIGWQLHDRVLMGLLANNRPINPLAAVALIVLGIGFISYWKNRLRSLKISGLIVAGIGLLALLNLGVDQLMFREQIAPYGLDARLADAAAICFILTGIIPLLIDHHRGSIRRVMYGVVGLITFLALFCIFGQLYAANQLNAQFAMAFNLALAFLLIAFAFTINFLHHQKRDVLGQVSYIGWLIVVALVLVQVATYTSWNQAHERMRQDSQKAFNAQVATIDSTVNTHLRTSIDALHGFKGLFAASEEVTMPEFVNYYQSLSLASHHPGMRSIGYVAAVNNDELGEFVATQRQYNPGFTIQSLSSYPRHFIATYNALDPQAPTLGLDASSIPGRYEIYNHAINSGQNYASGTITFLPLANQPTKTGFFITIPVKTTASTNYEGFVNVSFNYDDLFPALFKNIPNTSGLEITVIDAESKEAIYHTGSKVTAPTHDKTIIIPIVGNSNWKMRLKADANYGVAATQKRLPRSVIISGQLFSLLLIIIFIIQTRGRTRAIQLAETVTADLDEERQRILELHTRSEAILSGIGDGLIAVDEQGKIEMLNPVAQTMLGLESDKVIGQSLVKIVKTYDISNTPVKPENRPINIALKSGKVVTTKLQYTRSDGLVFPVQITTAPIVIDTNVIGAIEIFRDITDEVQLDKSKNEFVSLASHQLRTPLSAVNWYVEMLLNGDAGKLTQSQCDYLTEINKSNKRMIELVSSLLDVSRLDLGRIISQPKEVDVAGMVKDIEDEHVELIHRHKQTITKHIKPARMLARIDPKLLRLILQNLINNAVKYSPDKGKIIIDLRFASKKEVAAAQLKNHKRYLYFKVADNGIGIPVSQQPKIFNKFYRADNVHVLDVDGTGLGLYAVRQIVERLGGSVWFESHQNQGTTFHVLLPTETPTIDNGIEVT